MVSISSYNRWNAQSTRPRKIHTSRGNLNLDPASFNPQAMELLTTFFSNLEESEQRRQAPRLVKFFLASGRARTSPIPRSRDPLKRMVRDWASMGTTSAQYHRNYGRFLRGDARPFVM
jgi:hypothetical protein